MLFGSTRDFGLITRINRQLLQQIIEQEIGYYKLSYEDTTINIYGEASGKQFFEPVKLNCLITRGDQVISVQDYGLDMSRECSFAFLREDLVDTEILPEVGDIIFWHGDFYEVDNVAENQLFVGRDSNYNLTDYGYKFGSSLSVILTCHQTRSESLGLEPLESL